MSTSPTSLGTTNRLVGLARAGECNDRSLSSTPIESPQKSVRHAYACGLDLSGTVQGAGGVGGLLLVQSFSSASGLPAVLTPAYDGNGNVLAYLDAATGATMARYEYDPFGGTLVREEPVFYVAAALGPPKLVYQEMPAFRFSTKYTDEESDMLYYGYRYYSPELGKWISRDPINEQGFRRSRGISSDGPLGEEQNLYRMAANDPVNKIDLMGLLSTAKFIWWYETQLGATYDIVAEGELMELRQLSGMQEAEKAISKNAARSIKLSAISYCYGKLGQSTYRYKLRGNRYHANLTFAGNFWLGDTTLFWGVEGDVDVDCTCGTFKYKAPLKMSLRDRGEDPLYVSFIETGFPYSIVADWDINPVIEGNLDDR